MTRTTIRGKGGFAPLRVSGGPWGAFTFTAERYTFPYTRMRMELDHEKLDVYRVAVRKGKELLVRIVAMLTRMIERGNQVREGVVVYGYENVNENDG